MRDWEEQDVWLEAWRALLKQLDEKGELDWAETFADGSFAPAKKGPPVWAKPNVKGYEVDGSGRRPGSSSGKITWTPHPRQKSG